MRPEIKKNLYDILTAIEDLETFIKDAQFNDLTSNRMMQAAVEREFEIIGEALNRILRLNPDYLETIQDFKRIIGFRNIIVHGYDIIDYEILWDAATEKIKQLKTDIERLLKEDHEE